MKSGGHLCNLEWHFAAGMKIMMISTRKCWGLRCEKNLNYIYLEMDAFGAYIFVMLFTAIPSVSGSARLKYYLGGVEGERKGDGERKWITEKWQSPDELWV